MTTDVIVQVVPGGLRAVNGIESEKLDSLRGREVMAKLAQPRNIRFHRKFFALLGVARDMANTDFNEEQFRAFCIAGAGHCDFIPGHDGKLVAIPKSISFANMDETEFNRVYQNVLTFIVQYWKLNEQQLTRIVDFM